MDPLVRPAKREDSNFLAWAILAAARSHRNKGWFDIALNRPESTCLDYLQRLVLAPTRSWWHFSRFFVAEVDGMPISALSAFRAGDGYPLSQQAMTEAAHELDWGDAEQQAIWQRGAYIFTCTLEADDDVWAIENIATLPAYRGGGLASLLLERAIADGRRNGARQAQITFFIGNDAAERAYAKAGFKFQDEKRHPDFEAATGVPGLRRVTREI
jgi:GNAT superfamily N-acetyltransferase